jgi:hypothetical protein
MKTLQTLIDLLKSKATQTSENDDLVEFEKGKYFFGVVKNEKEFEGITISRKIDAKYANRVGFKIIDTIDSYSEKNEARIIRYLQD